MTVLTRASSAAWLYRYEQRAGAHADVVAVAPGDLDPSLVAVATPSLAIFQLGESGTGEHLIAAARRTGADPSYVTSLEHFVREEQEHARLLALVLDAFDAPRLDSHWTDRIFVLLRRAHSLRTEVLTLMVAEVVALSYYGALRDGIGDAALRDVFARIHGDEVVHVDFHCATLPDQLRRLPRPVHRLARALWSLLVLGAAIVVAKDHGRFLGRVGVSRRSFLRRVVTDLRRIAPRLFGT